MDRWADRNLPNIKLVDEMLAQRKDELSKVVEAVIVVVVVVVVVVVGGEGGKGWYWLSDYPLALASYAAAATTTYYS